ncbi:MAG: winged helix-turn-helix domain-containing protein [Actinomycetota bacterium]|nr:winged helix-turn-helix domain-containing protein [Actinomycetota bacterium]
MPGFVDLTPRKPLCKSDEVTAPDDVPSYRDLILPTLRAVDTLGGSAQAREITAQVVESEQVDEATLELTYDTRDKSIYLDRLDWARSYAKLSGALDSPKRGLFLLSTLGKEILAKPEQEAQSHIFALDRAVREARRASPKKQEDAGHDRGPSDEPGETSPLPDDEDDDSSWRQDLLSRLHALTPGGFEEFVVFLLRSYGLQMSRVGGTADEGIDGIGLAAINDVLSTRVAVQAKKYEMNKAISREQVALFQPRMVMANVIR